MSARRIEFHAAGDAALVASLGDTMDRAVSAAVLELARRIMAAGIGGVEEVVPAFAALTVYFDPLQLDARRLEVEIEALAVSTATAAPAGGVGRRHEIAVCYEDASAPDLAAVAQFTGLTPDEVVARHSAATYHVYTLGFLPGFPYLGDLDPRLRLPRCATPRVAVPAGSVAIAGAMTAVYPLESPGGWHIIGRTAARLFSPAQSPPARLAPGDTVRFFAVSRSELDRLASGGGDR